MTDTTVTTDPPLQNAPEARTPDGQIKDVRDQTPPETKETPKPETNPDGTPKADTTSADSSKPPADGAKKEEPKAPEGAPEKYADFKAPEGLTVDPKIVEAAVPIFKELNLNQDQAQKLFDFYTAQQKALISAPNEAFQETLKDWRAKTAAHPDIKSATVDGKTGSDAALIFIGRAKDMLPADLRTDFEQAMNSTGVGDHPAFVRAMTKFGQLFGEGKFVSGGGPSPHGQKAPGSSDKPSAAQALFPKLPSAAGA